MIGGPAPRRDLRFAHFQPIEPAAKTQGASGQLSTVERRRRSQRLLQILSGGKR